MLIAFVLYFDISTFWIAGVLHWKSKNIFSGKWDSVVGTVTRLRVERPRDQGRGKTHMSSPKRPDRLWGPCSLMFNGYRGRFMRG
jgi:hypothetical protein